MHSRPGSLSGSFADDSTAPFISEKGAKKHMSKYANAIPVHQPPKQLSERLESWLQNDRLMFIVYLLLSIFTRLYRIGSNSKVVWDEAHFGKFGSYYLRHTFYFDVHPPLGKILVSLAQYLSGYNGDFEFESGSDYPEHVPYIKMRVLMALYGIMMVPVAFLTAQSFGWNWRTRNMFVLMVLLDHGWLTISRFVLLDSMLLIFTLCVVLGLVRFHRLQQHSFTRAWWCWLFFTGVSIGCVSSVKMVGLFVTSLVGLYTMADLWDKFGDLKMPVRTYLRHWCARILALVIVPLLIYAFSFALHFHLLYKSGPGDAQMSSLFQSNLKGSSLSKYPLEAAYGSKVSLKNNGYGGGLLHSHVQTFPIGSLQQQVTCYHYKDTNNDFLFLPLYNEPQLPDANDTNTDPPRMLKSGDTVRMLHVETMHVLQTRDIPAPVTKGQHEVSGSAVLDSDSRLNEWKVEVVSDLALGAGHVGSPVRTLTTAFRLKNDELGCYLRAANVNLPDWGWKQVEVTCDPENNPRDEFTHWNIENHWNDRLPVESGRHFRSPFFKDLVHLNVAMMVANNALVPDEDKEDSLASQPSEWPWLWNGLRMNGWGADQDKYFLVGNVFVWWGSTASLIIMCSLLVWYFMRRQRRMYDLSPVVWDNFLFVTGVGLLGWFLHYLPFLIMGRVMYIHHYLPTLYFAVIVYCELMDHFLWGKTARYRFHFTHLLRIGTIPAPKNRALRDENCDPPCEGRPLSERLRNITFACTAALCIFVFIWFRAFSFGMYGDIKNWHGLQLRKSWNVY
ncbi:dolichyl-phosphate-mannose--protein mannosyltransferase [Malassezia vespertilionis]|uniref:Dolichyl-phosphate-mannose--protein mannosyltransferase n=1 Tax=Malassezia vespertilionis TaxID=2020962 RepID=A0A2N1JFB1_9BASI|nr:dolichyl-phosphate-mannose--protein mannosyltransferase [Malassezia vespertilionis]PKI85238.1 Pmt2p [Malassezia vespertilionis]WFD05522.1 dolichyl-phosphate-mannose--protein mannosyltransferase [Malassezia vespertilionis]